MPRLPTPWRAVAGEGDVRSAGTGTRGEPGPMERQTDGNGRRDGGEADPRIGRLEGAGRETWGPAPAGQEGPLAAAHWGWPQGKVTRTPFGQ